jgi:hypothetical protein
MRDLLDLPHTDTNHIENIMLDRAEGVFLWVSLVLGTVEEGLLSGDGVQELEKKILFYPVKLSTLFQHLVAAIHPGDRNWAFSAIAWVKYLQHHREAIVHYLGRTVAPMVEHVERLSVLQLSFLENSGQNPTNVRSCGSYIEKWKFETIKGVRRKLYGRCKVLLEVRGTRTNEAGNYGGYVTFTHRSVAEFLDTSHIANLIAEHTQSFEPFRTTCRAFLGCL